MDTYIVLHAQRGLRTRGPFDGASMPFEVGAADVAPIPKVELADLTDDNVTDLARDPEIAAIARPMPLALIEPVTAPAAQAAAATTWGVAAVKADTSPFDGAGVSVAVLDTGVDSAHAAFQGVTFVEKDFTGEGNGDLQGHGTHCAGTIFGRAVNGTRIGVAPGITRALIGKVLDQNGSGSSDALFNAMNWAVENGAQVISMSLGFDFPGMVQRLSQQMPVKLATSRALEAYRGNLRMFDALMEMIVMGAAFSRDAVVVAATGNESTHNATPPIAIAVSVPAAANHVVAVGAVGESPQGFVVANFSNIFPQVCAPGVGVESAKVGGGLRTLSGTSMATPHVAGLTALWRQSLVAAGVPLTSRDVLSRVLANASRAGFAPGATAATRGNGMAQAPQS